jgi:opacity protein-like surface antigen
MQAVMTGMVVAALSCAAAQAQAGTAQAQTGAAPAQKAAAQTQTDLGVSFYRTFTKSSSGNGTDQVPTNSTGGMLELRHIHSTWIGYEFTYSFNPADQTYSPTVGNCGYHCANPTTKVPANANEFSLDWVVSKQFGNVRPFAVGGLGFFVAVPSTNQYYVNTIVRPAYVFGGGVDWNFASHLGLRVQFRDNLYKAPNMEAIFNPTGAFTQSAEPMGGVFYRF